MPTSETGGFLRRTLTIGGAAVCVTSYQIGKRFCARVDNMNPGANIGRGMGPTREEAELASLANAASHLHVAMSEAELRARLGANEEP